jgi:hypothetical protein
MVWLKARLALCVAACFFVMIEGTLPHHDAVAQSLQATPINLTALPDAKGMVDRLRNRQKQPQYACLAEGSTCGGGNSDCCFPSACLCANRNCTYQICHR